MKKKRNEIESKRNQEQEIVTSWPKIVGWGKHPDAIGADDSVNTTILWRKALPLNYPPLFYFSV